VSQVLSETAVSMMLCCVGVCWSVVGRSPSEAPDALLSLLAALQRVRVLVAAGADELSRDKQVTKACQVSIHGCVWLY
jgi:hypothetical protein